MIWGLLRKPGAPGQTTTGLPQKNEKKRRIFVGISNTKLLLFGTNIFL